MNHPGLDPTPPRLLSFGEASWDRLWVLNRLPSGQGDCHVLAEHEAPGGCALNTACVISALGAPVSLGGNYLGADAYGEKIAHYLNGLGIEHRLVASPEVRTPVCQVLVEGSSGHRDFILSHADIHRYAAELLAGFPEEAASGRFSHVFLQCYSAELARAFLDRFNGSSSGSCPQRPWILSQDLSAGSEFVPELDAIQVSLPEGESWDAKGLLAVATPYFRGRLKTVFVTSGARGVAVCERGEAARLFDPVRPSRVVDTTGCGDAFRAGLMVGLYRGLPLDDAVQLGSRVGSRKAEILGSHFSDRSLFPPPAPLAACSEGFARDK